MNRARQAILPGYVLLCLLIGGSVQGMWGNAVLQLGAVGLLVWAALTSDPQTISRPARWLLAIVGGLLLLFVIQLLPLPPAIWTALPGRSQFVEGFSMLGMQLPALPISQSPYDTVAAAMTLLPPLAVLVAMLRLRCWTVGWMLAAILIGAAIPLPLELSRSRAAATHGICTGGQISGPPSAPSPTAITLRRSCLPACRFWRRW